jgi:hypothetical protein
METKRIESTTISIRKLSEIPLKAEKINKFKILFPTYSLKFGEVRVLKFTSMSGIQNS